MTRPTQKNEEIELAQIFLSAYYSDYSTQINFETCDDNKFEKLDVIATDNSKPKENTFRFQIKKIEFHPLERSQKEYSKEKGISKALSLKKEIKMKSYDSFGREPWDSALIKDLNKIKETYTDCNVRENMDLLFLVNISTSPDSGKNLTNLGEYGFRSISCILIRKGFRSIVLYAKDDAPLMLKNNVRNERACFHSQRPGID